MTAVLGINPEAEGFGAAVVHDGRLLAAIEQFKIRESWSSMEAVLPGDAIRTALASAGVKPCEVDVVAFVGDIASAERIIPHIHRLELNDRVRIEPVEHRVAHATAAFYGSSFDRALVFILGRGPDPSHTCFAVGDGTRIHFDDVPADYRRIENVYSRISSALGFHQRTANKIAWLGASGEPECMEAFRASGIDELVKKVTVEQPHVIAASLQAWTNETLIRLVEDSCTRHQISNICVAGDLAENPLLVRALEQHFGPDHVFVPPAPGRESLSIGAALVQTKRAAASAANGGFYPALGPEFSDCQIKSELDNCKLICDFFPGADALVEQTCKTLLEGGLVGWFQGRCEFGHRALGFRSILANPFTPYIDENINRFLKHREDFHPFVISVAEECVSRYFDPIGINARTIASVYPATDAGKSLLANFTIQGRYVRVHTVSPADNHLFWMLLQKMQESTGHPLLINSSFNLPNEPLVVTPRDAIRTFYASGLDVLAAGRFLVSK